MSIISMLQLLYYHIVFGYSILLFSVFVLFALQFWEISTGIFSSSGIPLHLCPSTNKATKGIFSFLLMFLISSISFWFFFRISISWLTLPISSCMLFYPLEPLAYSSQLFSVSWADGLFLVLQLQNDAIVNVFLTHMVILIEV